ncbi:MAG: hypothetical protein JSS66_07700 [Armatimonadetes bacterium]|nr:hypothetical protein [Armatimonadota bacterium]
MNKDIWGRLGLTNVTSGAQLPWKTIEQVKKTGVGPNSYSQINTHNIGSIVRGADPELGQEIQRKHSLGKTMFSTSADAFTLCGDRPPSYGYGVRQPQNFDARTSVHLHCEDSRSGYKLHPHAKVVDIEFRQDNRHYYSRDSSVVTAIEFAGETIPVTMTMEFARQALNVRLDKNGQVRIGEDQVVPFNVKQAQLSLTPSYTLAFACELRRLFNAPLNNVFALIKAQLEPPKGQVGLSTSGIAKALDKLQPFLDQLGSEEPLLYAMLVDLTYLAKRTVNSVKMSTVFNQTLGQVASYGELKKFLQDNSDKIAYSYYSEVGHFTERVLVDTEVYAETRKTVLKTGSRRAFNKLMEDVEFLDLDAERYPLLNAAITAGEIPVSTFFRKKEQFFLLNSNWQLWEEMLAHQPALAKELAQEVSKRTHYEKDLMSYFYFLLYGLPEYLQKHTGRKWRVTGKLVDSPNELEAPRADQAAGVSKKRSALTPIVENELSTVVVPYASLALHGRMTTYCYSHDYHLLERGFSFNGNATMSDLEEKLNGRDDYGLMFYTLTGSQQGRGYPTFLIIFERRSDMTYVHFHRTHPCRSKDGDYNPVHDWVKVCYNWMVGNIPAKDIVAQQGDMVFVQHEHKMPCNELVMAYEGHCFDRPVKFAPYEKKEKQNVLGYLQVDGDTWLRHGEHEDVLIPAGDYEVRQCRSWEANPVAVWTLRID